MVSERVAAVILQVMTLVEPMFIVFYVGLLNQNVGLLVSVLNKMIVQPVISVVNTLHSSKIEKYLYIGNG